MISSTNDATAKLTTALMMFPRIEECHAVLRAGGIPIDQWSCRLFQTLFFNIRCEYGSRLALRRQSHLAKPLERIDRALNSLVREFENDACSLAAEMIGAAGSIAHGLTMHDTVAALHYKEKAYHQIYHMPQKHLENWLFSELYQLYAILMGKRPGNSIGGPLFRFTKEAADIVGMKFTITPEAFRMRIKRFGDRRGNEPESPARVPTNGSHARRPRFLLDVLPEPDPIQLFSFMKK